MHTLPNKNIAQKPHSLICTDCLKGNHRDYTGNPAARGPGRDILFKAYKTAHSQSGCFNSGRNAAEVSSQFFKG